MVSTAMRDRRSNTPATATAIARRGESARRPRRFDNSTAIAEVPKNYHISTAKANKAHPLNTVAAVLSKIALHGLPRIYRADCRPDAAGVNGIKVQYFFYWPDGGSRIVIKTQSLRDMGLYGRVRQYWREKRALGRLTNLQKKAVKALWM